ncbi:MAG: ParB N-terminal domain-containing protein [Oribacterium sp.]|nr:ParB N-terminal domain-containing protein [Oribacterium sp.]
MKPVSNAPKVMDGEVKLISLDKLVPFARHKFTLYQGERLDDMVESIRKNGVIVPIIARTIEGSDKFEIISGHNRVYASGLAGLEKVPAVIKVGLSDEEAMIYAIDSNLIQRSFRELKISEQAYAVTMRYKKLFDEKKLKAIDDELQSLMGIEKSRPPVGDGGGKRVESLTAKEYGIGHTTVARLIRINELCDELKKLVDTGNIKIRPAVELSYLPIEAQKSLYECMSRTGQNSIDQSTAWELKELYKKKNELTPDMIEQILSGRNALSVALNKGHRIALAPEVYDKYLKDLPKKEVVSIVEKALEMYFKGERA